MRICLREKTRPQRRNAGRNLQGDRHVASIPNWGRCQCLQHHDSRIRYDGGRKSCPGNGFEEYSAPFTAVGLRHDFYCVGLDGCTYL